MNKTTDIEIIYELSPMQHAMLVHSLAAPGSGVYVLQTSLRLTGRLDVSAFEQAWHHVVARHAILRTAFFWENLEAPRQVVFRRVGLEVARESWHGLAPDEQRARLTQFLDADREKGFELAEAPLMRLALFELGPEIHQLVWTQHHLIVDGWSQGRVLQELLAAYAAFAGGREPRLETPRAFADYMAWLRRQDAGKAEAFWRASLAAFTAPTFIADGRLERPTWRESRRRDLALPTAASAALREVARRRRLTLNTLVQGAWSLLLARTAGRQDVVFGATVAGRPADLPGVESIVGPFINTLPVRVEVRPERRLREWLGALQARQVETRRSEHAPLVDVQRWSELPAGVALFDHVLVFENLVLPAELSRPLPDLEVVEEAASSLATYPLMVVALPGRDLTLSLRYDAGRFEPVEIARMLEHLAVLLAAFAEDRDTALEDLPLLGDAERHQILWEHNDTRSDDPCEASLPALFAARVAATPEAPAVVEADGEVWTYRRLDEASSRLAEHLRTRGVRPGARVAVEMERSAGLIVALLGILKTGAAYVPLDPGAPEERRAFLLEDTGAAVVLDGPQEILPTVETPRGASPAAAPFFPKDPCGAAGISEGDTPRGVSTVGDPDALAYIIYTSGSTGRPKGVAVSHRAIVRLVREMDDLTLGPKDRLAFNANVSFDAATFEIWATLLAGAALVVIPRDLLLAPAALVEDIQRQRVTVLHLTAALFAQVAREAPAALSFPRCVLFGGEASAPAAVARALEAGRPRRLLQMYGPTESTTFATWYPVAEVPPGAATVPIGRPLANTTVHVLDCWQQLAPLERTGELFIGGDGLAWGYWNRPDLTAERFLPDPWSAVPGGRLYRTGDLVRRRPDGALEFQGRVDHQVKIRGFRIEPGEVEAVLAGHPEVRVCAVVVREEAPGARRLVGYVVLDRTDSKPAFAAWLQERLPEYMVPSAFVVLEALPLTPNGKLDRKALPAPEPEPSTVDGFAAPTDPVEELLAGIWAEVLGRERVGIHEDFFALGGHSLLATQVASRVRDVLGADLPLRHLFETPTVAGLAQVVRAGLHAAPSQAPPLVPGPRQGDLPLSFAQQRLWLVDQLEPGNPVYNMPSPVRLRGELARALLERIFGEIVRRHEALRTTFLARDGRPVQVIAASHPLDLPLVDLTGLPAVEREARARALAREEAGRPFDLQGGPLLRLTLVRMEERDHLLLLTVHHIVSDGWSMGVLLREIAALHEAFAQGRPSPLPELPVQYADFAVWQRGWLQGEVLRGQLDHWKRQLAGAPQVLALPTDRPRPGVQTFRGRMRPVALPGSLSAAVAALGRQEGVTPYMALLAAWTVLLGRLADQEEVLVGSPIAGRNRREIEGLIGFFVNTLVLRSDLSGNPSFKELLERVRRTALDAFAHQDLPFERLVDELVAERDLSIPPLVQVLFALQNAPAGELAVPGLSLAPVASESGVAKIDLALTLAETPAGIAGVIEHNTDLFDGSTAERLWARFAALLEAAAADPDRSLDDLPLLLPGERHQLLREHNDTRSDDPREASLPVLFAAQVAAAPEAPAVVEADGEVWTYRRLDEASSRVARHLRARGVAPGARVAVAMERSAGLIVALLGILKAGAAYVPLDPGLPEERRAFLLEDTGAEVVLEANETPFCPMEILPTVETPRGASPAAAPFFPKDPCGAAGISEGDAPRGVSTVGGPDALAYIIYTSGSTGRPKGVAVSHRAIVRLVRETDYLRLGPEDRLAFNANPSFDAATFEIWATLLSGAALVVIPRDLLLAPKALAEHLRRQRVTVLHLTAALFAQVAREAPEAFRPLRCVLFGGEASAPAAVARALEAGRPGRLLQMYGPTESTTFATWHPVAEVPPEAATVPIGRPLANTTAYVLDPWQRLAPLEATGELFLGGEGLAWGYWNRPDLTAERFVPDPWSAEPGGRLYRTGDLVRRRPDGVLEFQGRIDSQVKIRGFRIEPGEVEAVLAELPGVEACAVVVREGRLAAYVVLHRTDQADRTDRTDPTDRSDAKPALAARLRQRLPDYMVPSAFVVLEALPLTPNGKVDRKALPAPEMAGTAPASSAGVPDPLAELVAGVLAEVLGRERVGVNDDFFALGGHSLLATQVVSRLRDVLGAELPLRRLFEQPTAAGLARAMREDRPGALVVPAPPLRPVPREDDPPVSFAQQRLWFIDQLEPGSPAYNMPFPVRLRGEVAPRLLGRVFAEIVRRHETLRTTFDARDGRPVQVIDPLSRPEIPLVDLIGLPEGERDARARQLALAEARRPFDLRRGPLLRLTLLRLAAREHVLLMTMHHIVSDGWSMGVLLREVAALSAAYAQGRPSPLPELPVQYADFAVWQRSWLQGAALEAQLGYWKERLAGAPRALDLATDRPRPPVQTSSGASRIRTLPAAPSAALQELCRREGATPFMALLAAWSILLGRHAGQEEVLVGTPVAGRNRREIEGLIGFFVNTLVLRVALRPEGKRGFGSILRQVRATALDAFAHQDLPFERIVEEVVPERDPSRPPLFQAMLALQNAPRQAIGLPGLTLAPLGVETGTAKVELSLALWEGPDGFVAALEYNTDLFDGTTAERLLARFAALVEAAVEKPAQPIDELPLLLPAERHQTLVEHNDTRTVYPRETGLAELFAEVAREMPEAPAVVAADGEVWSYRRLDEESTRLARRLRSLGAGPEAAVGISMERSLELILGIVAIVKTGGTYVPLDSGYPDERLAFLMTDSGARLVLVHEPTRGRMEPLIPDPRALVDVTAAALESLESLESWEGGGHHRLAYLIYTSGSTGQPKGVAVPQRAVVRLVRETSYVRLGPGDRVAHLSNISFDAATFEIWGALLNGAAVVVVPREVALEPAALAALLLRRQVTALFLTTALFNQVARQAPGAFSGLCHVLFGGEAADRGAVALALEQDAPERLLHVYGPTESTTFASWHHVTDLPPDAATVPIGLPLANTSLWVLDRAQRPVPPGMAGELFLGGDGLARGYWNRPELTAERFIPHPWPPPGQSGERLYRTGDLVRRRADGPVEFLGRIDNQVKIRGFRIELGEIEAVLGSHPAVREAVALVRDGRLAAYVVLDPTDPTDRPDATSALTAWLRERLPQYMLPSAFVVLEALPLTPNGKVDRKALPAPAQSRDEGFVAPSDPVEELLAGVWAEVLGRERVGVHDDFFALGGHSLLATQVMSRLRSVLGVELPLRRLFESPTVAELARAVRSALRPGGGEVSLERAVRAGDPPLSFAQQRLWLIDQLDPGSAAYNMPLALRLTGEIDPGLLRRVFTEIVRRHEALRTTFAVQAGAPVQVIAAEMRLELPLLDLTVLPEAEREAQAWACLREDARQPFDLRTGPLLRLLLLRLAGSEHVLLLNMHHIVSDGWSMGVLLREVAALYPAFAEGRPSPLPELPLQYADFAVWQREWLRGAVLEEQLDYWKRRLAGAPRVLELPTDRPRPAVQTFRGVSRPAALPRPLSERVQELCRREGATPFMALLAAWAVLLGRHAGQRDVLLGTPIAGRNRREIEDLIGFFVNTLVLRVELDAGTTFAALVRKVRETALDAFAHQDVPFERLVEELVPERDLAVPPLFQVLFVLQNAPVGALNLPRLSLAPISLDSGVAKFDLTLSLGEGEGVFAGVLEHSMDLFDGSTAARLLARFEALLDGAMADPGQSVDDLPLLLPAELQQTLVEPNETRAAAPPEATLPALFAERVALAPEAPAVIFAGEPGEVLSYAELDRRSARWAQALRELGAGPEVRVAICLRRSPRLIVSLLAVLRAGGAYVPLDPAWPAERLAWMLEDAGVELVLAETETAGLFEGGPHPRPLSRERERGAGLKIIDMSGEAVLANPHPSPACGRGAGGEGSAYVIYTSGSTGKPKGVVATQGSFAAFTQAMAGTLEIGPGDRSLQFSSLSFDAAAITIWPALIRGAAVILHPDPTALSARDLLGLCTEQSVSVVDFPAALWRQMVQELDRAGLRFGPTLRRFLTGGEGLAPETVRQWARIVAPETRLVSCYGPTETTVVVSVFELAGRQAEVSSLAGAPLGRPFPGTGLYLLDGRLAPVPLDVPGEIYIGGAGVTRGYLGRPDQTAAIFLPDPWGPPGARMYRTGDRARRRPDGGLDFLGRVDQQVKIRGFRIEPGEIEAVLGGHPAVRETVVLARPSAAGDLRLVAYVVLDRTDRTDPKSTLAAWLRERLPQHLVPSAFVVLDAFPLSATGKVDRKALPEPEPVRAAEEAGSVPPSDPVEELLAGIWAEVLRVDRVGVHDDFFSLGGHSLLATQVVSRVRDVLGVELPLRRLFGAPTIAGLARLVREAQQGEGAQAAPIAPVPREGDLPLSFAQQRLWFLEQLEPGNPAYHMPQAMRLTGRVSVPLLERILAAIVRRHEALRTTFEPRGVQGTQPAQVIGAPGAPALPVLDLSGLAEEAREALALRLARAEAVRPFDLRRGPLLRQTLLRLGQEEHLLLLTQHHIVSDGWSMGVLVREITELYRAFSAGEPPRLPDLPVQYADYAVWQRSRLQGDVLERELAWWRGQLAGVPPLLELPTDRPRPPVQSFRGGLRPVRLPAELAEGMRAAARREGATLFMALLAGFQGVLSRASAQEQVAVGTPIAGRNRLEIESLIGFFVNTLVLPGDLSGAPGFRVLLGRARDAALGAYAHQEVPFERLVEELAPERSLAHAPLFQVMLVLQNTPQETLVLEGLRLSPAGAPGATAKFDLTLALQEHDGGIAGTLTYASDLFDTATLDRLLGHFERLLAAAMAAPETPVEELPLLAPAEEDQLLVQWNDTAVPVPMDLLLHERIDWWAAAMPDVPAVLCGDERLTFAELSRKAKHLARHLRAQGVGPDTRVALRMERSPELIVGLLATLEAGGAFVVLDPAQPEARLEQVLRDAKPTVVLTREDVSPSRRDGISFSPGFQPGVGGEGPAYVIYTSGSTGTPKGVVIRHSAVINLLAALEATVYRGAAPGLRVSVNAPLYFDGAVKQVIQLAQGRTLCLVPDEVRADADALGRFLAEQRVDVFDCTPAQLKALLDAGWGQDGLPVPGRVLVGGEAVDQALWDRLRHLGGIDVFNVYGPSECTVDTTVRKIALDAPRPVLGRPLANVRTYVLTPALLPQPTGHPGELCVGGAGLARGYLGRPDLTAERFIPDPFSGDAGARLYRTGDLARWLPQGELEFLGRTDHQVKVRGFRIELGEIEVVLLRHPAVRDAVALAREGRLVAYVVLQRTDPTDPSDANPALAAWLRERLPQYMLPSAFVLLDALPLSPNGKVDRRALPEPERVRGDEGTWVAPSDPVEELLAGIWSEVLKVDRVGARDSFFALGGHSLLATQVISRIRGVLGVDLPLRELFEAPTLADLARAVRAARERESLPAPPLASVPREDRGAAFPLSFSQQRLWFLDQIEPGNAAYNMPMPVRLRGELSVDRLERIFQEVVRRHEALRTTFTAVDGQPVQVIHPELRPELRTLDLADQVDAEEQALRTIQEDAWRPFDLRTGPLLRLTLVRLAERDHVLLLTLHHIVSDGWSMGVLLREIGALYEAFAQGRPSPLPELPLQYPDFAVWQREWLQGAVLDQQLAFWRERLADAPAVLEMPTDRPRPAVQTFHGATAARLLTPAAAAAVRELCRQEGVTPFMALLAAWAVLLGRHAGQDDVVVGTPVAARNRREIEDLIGFFVNSVALRVDLDGGIGSTFRDLLARVRRLCLDAFTHQDLPFERIVEEVVAERDLSRAPLFQVMLVLNAARPPLAVPGLTFEPVAVESLLAKLDLTLTVQEHADGFAGALEHNTDLFDGATAERLLARFEALLASAAQDPGQTLSALPLLLPEEQRQALHDWNGTAADRPAACLHELIAAQADRTPDAKAVTFLDQSLTYADLLRRTRRIAQHLQALGIRPEDRVGVFLERSLDLLPSLLGTLTAGAAYLPLDPALPAERLATLIDSAGATVVLTQEDLAARLPMHVRMVIPPLPGGSECVWERGSGSEGGPGEAGLAYVLYTSGSTGTPKGVMIPHGSLVAYLAWCVDAYGLAPGRRSLVHSSIGFDLTVTALFAPLLAGGEVRLLPESDGIDGLAAAVAEQDVHLLKLTPAHLEVLGRLLGPDAARRVSTLVVGGETLYAEALDLWRTGAPGTRVVNEYGPTETTVGCSVLALPAGEIPSGRIAIGHPIANTRLYVIDQDLQLLPPGARGELLIGGDGLARGYLGRPDLTAERFVPDPFGGPGERLYRTGDLAFRRPDGAFDFLGRFDHQVKIRGYRIELGEIEAVLLRHPAVHDAVALVRDGRLVAYVVLDRTDSKTALAAWLRERLPEYMLPAAFVLLDALPLTPNGKVDRKALPAPEHARGAAAFVSPRDPLELALAHIWAEVLGLPAVGVRDDFFALGGHSLLAVQLTARLRSHLGHDIPLVTLLRHPTVERLAQALREGGGPTRRSALVELAAGEGTPLFCIHPIGGEVLCYVPLARHLAPERSVYGLQAPDREQPFATIEDMAAEYLDSVRKVQPEGPYTLAGWSLGGVVAFEMARQLENQGEAVDAVLLIDSFAPAAGAAEALEGGALVASFAFDLARQLGIDLAGLPPDLLEREPEDLLHHLATQAEAAGLLPPGLDTGELTRRYTLFEANHRALASYNPEPGSTRLLLIRASKRPIGRAQPEHDLGWTNLAAGSLEIHELPGDHYDLLREPAVAALAAIVRETLASPEWPLELAFHPSPARGRGAGGEGS